MPKPRILRERRQRLAEMLDGGTVLLMGHTVLPRNYLANPLPYRQDSTFLFFTGCHRPNSAALIHPDGELTLFLTFPEPDDELWHGRGLPLEFVARKAGTHQVEPFTALAERVARMPRRTTTLHTLPVADPAANQMLCQLTGKELDPRDMAGTGSQALMEAVIELRLRRDPDELEAMRKACAVTARAHHAAMAATHPGVMDYEIHALIEAVFTAAGMSPAYPPIVTIEGEVLHGRANGLKLKEGHLLLVDAGAEHPDGYASDVTRTWPVSGKFDEWQTKLYTAVNRAHRAAVQACAPGVRFRDVHLAAARKLTEELVEVCLMKGDVDELVERGAHAVFFPHGVGHLIGLDVHDLELFGDQAGYGSDNPRDSQFGLSYLRLDRKLEPGMVVTIEPGFYVIPNLLSDSKVRDRLGDAIMWDAGLRLAPFGGIRIEDDVLITEDGNQVLTEAIVRSASDIEDKVGSGPTPQERFAG